MATASRICQNLPALQGRIDELNALAAEFVENSTFGGGADNRAQAEAECKGAAHTGICDNDTRSYESLKAMQGMVGSLQSFVNADIVAFTEADGMGQERL